MGCTCCSLAPSVLREGDGFEGGWEGLGGGGGRGGGIWKGLGKIERRGLRGISKRLGGEN